MTRSNDPFVELPDRRRMKAKVGSMNRWSHWYTSSFDAVDSSIAKEKTNVENSFKLEQRVSYLTGVSPLGGDFLFRGTLFGLRLKSFDFLIGMDFILFVRCLPLQRWDREMRVRRGLRLRLMRTMREFADLIQGRVTETELLLLIARQGIEISIGFRFKTTFRNGGNDWGGRRHRWIGGRWALILIFTAVVAWRIIDQQGCRGTCCRSIDVVCHTWDSDRWRWAMTSVDGVRCWWCSREFRWERFFHLNVGRRDRTNEIGDGSGGRRGTTEINRGGRRGVRCRRVDVTRPMSRMSDARRCHRHALRTARGSRGDIGGFLCLRGWRLGFDDGRGRRLSENDAWTNVR